MKNFIFIALGLFLMFAHAAKAEDAKETFETKAVSMMMNNCIAANVNGVSAAELAKKHGLPEIDKERAAAFLRGEKGKVFWDPAAVGAVLVVTEKPTCSVLIKTLDHGAFWEAADGWFGQAPFTSVSKNETDNELEKKYKMDITGGKVSLIVRSRKKVSGDGQIQGQLVAARTKD